MATSSYQGLSPAAILEAQLAQQSVTPPPPPPPSAVLAAAPAGFFPRFFAWLIDLGVIMALDFLVGFISVMPAVLQGQPVEGATLLLLPAAFAANAAYFVILECGPAQGTLGKQCLGLKIVNAHGGRISGPQSLGRLLVKALFSGWFLCLGYLLSLGNPRRQALHDMAAGTFVVRR